MYVSVSHSFRSCKWTQCLRNSEWHSSTWSAFFSSTLFHRAAQVLPLTWAIDTDRLVSTVDNETAVAKLKSTVFERFETYVRELFQAYPPPVDAAAQEEMIAALKKRAIEIIRDSAA